jgi:hypothetical protein
VRSSVSASHDKDLVEFDFGGPIGRSPSGSLASCESPSRSRTSSFGQASRDEHHGHRGPSPHASTPMCAVTSPSSEKPSYLFIANMLRNSTLMEEVTPPSNIDSSDYVFSDSPHTSVSDGVAAARTQPNSPAVRIELDYAALQLPPSTLAASATSISSVSSAPKESDANANKSDYAVVDVAKCKSVRSSSRSGQLSPR